MNILKNKSLEVTKDQYHYLRIELAGLIFHRIKDHKYYVMPVLSEGVRRLNIYFNENT